MFQALRIRDFRLLWAGSLASALGSWLLILAIPAHIFLATGSLRATGLTLAAGYLPILILGPVAGVFTDRRDRRRLMIATNLLCAAAVAASLTATAAAYFLLFTSSSPTTALPAAAAIGMAGSISLVTPQTAIQRAIPNAVLGRVSAVFLTGQAVATLTGAAAGPFLAQAAHFTGVATAASLATLSAAVLTFLIVPRMPAIIPGQPITGPDR